MVSLLIVSLCWLRVATTPLWPYEEKLGRVFSALTQASYCGADQHLRNWTCRPCQEAGVQVVPGSVRFISRRELVQPNATFVLIARLSTLMEPRYKEGCIISFRGSDNFMNWIEDFRFWNRVVPFDWCSGCYVEDGFSSVWRNVESELLSHLADIGCVPVNRMNSTTSSSLFITGHSLGAAVGTLAMCTLKALGFNVSLSYIFESPRVGNAAFAAAFEKEFTRTIPMYRITHARDPVPHLPPPNLVGFKYVHVNYEVWYDVLGKWHFCPKREDLLCADRYNLLTTLLHPGDHCATPLAPGGTLCECPVPYPPQSGGGAPPSALLLV